MRPLKFLVCAVAVLPLLLGAGAGRADPVKIRVAWVVPVSNMTSILYAKPGLATHQGKSYDGEPMRFQGTPPMITALASGELEIALFAYSSFALAVENAGMGDLRIIADEDRDGVPGYATNAFAVRADSPIRTVEDLKGKVLGTNAVGSAVDIAMRAVLLAHHLDPKTDVSVIETSFPNMKSMLTERKVDLATSVPPFSEDPEFKKISRILFTQRDALGSSELAFLVARQGFIDKNRAALVDFLEDYLRALHFYTDPANHKEAVEIAANFSKLPPAIWEPWLYTHADYYRDPAGLPDLDALHANTEVQARTGFLKEPLDTQKYADLSLVKEAAARFK